MDMQFTVPDATLQKTKEVITINQLEKDIPIDLHFYDIFTTYSAIIRRALSDLNEKFTWNELYYMLASINGTTYSNADINLAVTCFIGGLIDFEIYDEVQAGQFCIDAKELSAKLQKEHPISVFSLVFVLHQYWIGKKVFDDAQQYIEQYLQLKVQ